MSAGESTERSTAPLSSSVLGIAIVAITGMQLMSTLDGTIVIVALPRMQADLDLSDVTKSWIITAYVLTFGGLLLLAYACYREREGERAARAAKDLFAYSVLYLFLLFAVLLVEHAFGVGRSLPALWTS